MTQLNPAELWQASQEAFESAEDARAQGLTWWANFFAECHVDFADMACAAERRLGIVREYH
jgi:hypothetical protein